MARAAQGASDEIVSLCVDTIALGRDLAYNSIVGLGIARLPIEDGVEVCTPLLRALPESARQRARAQLALVAAAFPTASRLVPAEAVFAQLLRYGPVVPAATLAQLPPVVRPLTARCEELRGDCARWPHQRWALALTWADDDRSWDELAVAVDLPAPERARRLAALERPWLDAPAYEKWAALHQRLAGLVAGLVERL